MIFLLHVVLNGVSGWYLTGGWIALDDRRYLYTYIYGVWTEVMGRFMWSLQPGNLRVVRLLILWCRAPRENFPRNRK